MIYHLHLKNRKRFFTIIALFVFVVVLLATFLTVNASNPAEKETRLLIVHAGDTLWEIASENCSKGDIRNYISDVKRMNELETSTIYAGQCLYLPIQ